MRILRTFKFRSNLGWRVIRATSKDGASNVYALIAQVGEKLSYVSEITKGDNGYHSESGELHPST